MPLTHSARGIGERCRIGRDYGNPGDYDCRFVGLNARMSEVHAAIALASMDDLDERLARREELAVAYRRALDTVPGIAFPQVRAEDSSTFKDLTILVDPDLFELDADRLHVVLGAEGIETKRYYSPPVHRMRAYRTRGSDPVLPVTDSASARALTLPLWIGMTVNDVELVATAIRRVQGRPAALAARDASPPVA
jgi:dTDP-4-amino-4,6-dideoxygalactose transaminase